MKDNSEIENVSALLREAHERFLQAVAAAQRAGPECPPEPRVAKGRLLEHEHEHVAGCRHCSRVVSAERKLLVRRRVVWVCVGAAILLLTAIYCRPDPAHGIPQLPFQPDSATKRDLELHRRVGDRNMAELQADRNRLTAIVGPQASDGFEDRKLQLAKRVGSKAITELAELQVQLADELHDTASLEQLDAIRYELSFLVKPEMLVELEKLTVRNASSVPPALLVQFQTNTLEKVHRAGPTGAVQLEREKAALLERLPAPVVLELEQEALKTARVCGPKVLEYLVSKHREFAGRLDNKVLIQLAHRYSALATAKIHPGHLLEIVDADFQREYLAKYPLNPKYPKAEVAAAKKR